MSIVSENVLVPESNIIINIYVKKIKADNTEKLDIITVEGEVAWVNQSPDPPSKMGIKFKESNEELVRIYSANIQSSK